MIWKTAKAFPYKDGYAIKVEKPDVPHLSDEVYIGFRDDRAITREQQKRIWALLEEIAGYGWGAREAKKEAYKLMCQKFLVEYVDTLTAEAIKRFSISTTECRQSEASEFLDFLIRFIVEEGIPTQENLASIATDVEAYVYACCMNRKCAVCGMKADIHHVEGSKVGMGANRDEMVHIGREVLPLCRKHHNEAHDHGDAVLIEKYHLKPVTVDEKMARELKLGRVKQ